MKLFKSIDIYGIPIGYEDSNSTKFNTLQGGFFTLIIGIATIIIGFIFGKELYLRTNPNIKYSKQLLDTSSVQIANMTGIVITFVDSNVVPINHTNYFDTFAAVYSFNENSKISYYSKAPLVTCNESTYPYGVSNFLKSNCVRGHCLCLDPSIKYNITNNYVFPNSTFIHLPVYPCNPKQRKCADDLSNVLKNFFYTISFVNSYVDGNDYNNPIKEYLETLSYQMSISLYKRIYVSITNNTFTSDNGWLLEDNKIIYFPQISQVKSDIIVYSEGLTPIGAYSLDSPNLTENIRRSYMKMQNLLANVGGFFNTLNITMLILSFNYLRFNYLLMILNKSQELKDKYNKSILINNKKVNPSELISKNINNKENDEHRISKFQINKLEQINNTKKSILGINKVSFIFNENQNIINDEVDPLKITYFKYIISIITCSSYKKKVNDLYEKIKVKLGIENLVHSVEYFSNLSLESKNV